MNWGKLSHGFKGVAIKQLSAHEVDPHVSRGHEFQGANNLVELLKPVASKNRPTTYIFVDDTDFTPTFRDIVKSTSSWYNSRENQPHRSAEWRLYYPTEVNLIHDLCQKGDLLLLGLRHDDSLVIFLAPKGSVSEELLLQAFGVTLANYVQSGQVRWLDTSAAPPMDFISAEAMEQLSFALEAFDQEVGAAITSTIRPDPTKGYENDPEVSSIAGQMLQRWAQGALGSTLEVVKLVVDGCSPAIIHDVDYALEHWLEVAEASYRVWEKEMACKFLSPIRFDRSLSDLELVEKIGVQWMSFRQSRVSRAGKVMEEFLSLIFRHSKLRFVTGKEAKTENGKLPDFLFPDQESYYDASFPAENLRILGSKTSFKDRWRQILAEGDRVVRKHGVTRDSLITESMFEQMNSSNLTVVMPLPIIKRYKTQPKNLISLTEFITEVRQSQQKL